MTIFSGFPTLIRKVVQPQGWAQIPVSYSLPSKSYLTTVSYPPLISKTVNSWTSVITQPVNKVIVKPQIVLNPPIKKEIQVAMTSFQSMGDLPNSDELWNNTNLAIHRWAKSSSNPELRKLYQEAMSATEGKLSFKFFSQEESYFCPFNEADYCPETKVIRVKRIKPYSNEVLSIPKVLSLFIFEIANATTSKELDKLNHTSHLYPNETAFAEAVEFVEFNNTKKHVRVIEKGIQDSAWSSEMKRYTLSIDFGSYFQTALSNGHANLYTQQYKLSRIREQGYPLRLNNLFYSNIFTPIIRG
jgi:hypothetical protein